MKLLETKNLSKTYGKAVGFALKRCSLAFPSSGLIAVLGKSGSGKSTLLNLLSGLETPTKGDVLFRGIPYSKMKASKIEELRLHEIGFVFQHYNLIDRCSVKENILLPTRMSGERRNIEDVAKRFGLETILKKRVDVCSGGEKQRVAIARSVIRNPSILFADEPTGALDEKNAAIVMECLKEASRDRLVVLVSHNAPLAISYADGVIRVEDGKVRWEKEPSPGNEKPKRERKGRSSSWRGRFVKRNLKRNAKKNALCLLSGILGFSSVLLGVGYREGSQDALVLEARKTPLLYRMRISESTLIELPNSPLSLTQNKRPKKEDAEALLRGINCRIGVDYAPFVPEAAVFAYEGALQDPASIVPLPPEGIDCANALLSEGKPMKEGLEECLINRELASVLGDCLGKEISFSSSFSIASDGVKETLTFPFCFRIAGVVEEFSFLNSPRVYYSYEGLSSLMEETELPLIAEKRGEWVSLASFAESVSSDSSYSNYGYLLFPKDATAVEKLYSLADSLSEEGNPLSISSEARNLETSFSSLLEAFSLSLGFFLIISLVGVCFILGIAGYSSYLDRKKESAVLMSLGARRRDIRSIFLTESMAVSGIAGALSLLLSPLLERLANALFASQIGADGLVRVPLLSWQGIPGLLPLALLLFSFLISFLSTAVPFSIAGRFSLSEELKDE